MTDLHNNGSDRAPYVLPPMPDGLPWIIFYRLGDLVKSALPRTPVMFVGSNGGTNAAIVCPQIPSGATGWQLAGETLWKPLRDLPPEWLPFLNRRRGTRHDPRRRLAP